MDMNFPPLGDAVLASLGPSYNHTVVMWLKEQTIASIGFHKAHLEYHEGILEKLNNLDEKNGHVPTSPPMSPTSFQRPNSGGPKPIKLADLAKQQKRRSVAPTPKIQPDATSPEVTPAKSDVQVTFTKPKPIKPIVDEDEQGAQAMTHFTKPTARKMNKTGKTPKFNDIADTPIARPNASLSVTLPVSPKMMPSSTPPTAAAAASPGAGAHKPSAVPPPLHVSATPRATNFAPAATPSGVKLPPGAFSMMSAVPAPAAKSPPISKSEDLGGDRSGTPATETMDLDEIYADRGGMPPITIPEASSLSSPPSLPSTAPPALQPPTPTMKPSAGPPPLPKASMGPPPLPAGASPAIRPSSGGSKPPPLPGMPAAPSTGSGGPPPLPGGSVSGRVGPPPVPPPNSAPLSSVQRLSDAFEKSSNKPPPGANFSYMTPRPSY